MLTFKITPFLPPALEPLRTISYNLRWTWHHDAIELCRRNNDLWEASHNNPALMLGAEDQATLEAAASDEGFLARLRCVAEDFAQYQRSESTWFRKKHGKTEQPLIAYCSAEFGLTDCLSIFAGGLGILAGDHLKSASDLGVPLVAVGLLYQQGYFRQYLNEAGWQQEAYEDNDFHNLPLRLEQRADGSPLTIAVSLPGRQVMAQIWRAQVGRVALYLLDTNIAANARREDQDITDQLYGGDTEMRLKQEILLGVGGARALEALGLEPRVYHLNEGHSVFLALERIRREMETHGLTFAEAREAASAGLIFTTHTAAPAGHDHFPPELMNRYFSDYAGQLGLSFREFMTLGRRNPNDDTESFGLTVLALRLACASNGVSRLHAQVSRKMWQSLWPGVPEDEVPIGHISNGVHFQSWISQEMEELYDRYLGPRWREEPAEQSLWARSSRIASEELWRTHERRRERLVAFARRRLRAQLERRGAPQSEIEDADEVLDPDILTICFARRFATYKRATLILRDPARLARILNDPDRPAQLIFAGRAHPRDDEGKEMIRQIVVLSRKPEFRRRLVFLEGHDMAVTRSLTQGADVWLNTPRRPLEASGTSGMKAAANGVLNLSTLDGWWDEAWNFRFQISDFGFEEKDGISLPSAICPPQAIGWAIGRGETYADPHEQDEIEAAALYEALERDVIPTFYERGADRLPRRWIAMMKSSISNLCGYFNTHRMTREYTERCYLPAAERQAELMADGMKRAKALAQWKERIAENWAQARIEAVESADPTGWRVGEEIRVRARVRLGRLRPDDVIVELYAGLVNGSGEIIQAEIIPMKPVSAGESCDFETSAVPRRSGLYGCTVRVRPHHADLTVEFLPGMIFWAQTEIGLAAR
jgi:starch phosphorylase